MRGSLISNGVNSSGEKRGLTSIPSGLHLRQQHPNSMRERSIVGTAAQILLLTFSWACQAGAATYVYDAAGRLQAVQYDNCAQVTYTLDAAGNRTQVSSVAGSSVGPPSGLAVTPVSATSLKVSWTAATSSCSKDSYRYYIYRDGASSPTVTTSVGATSYVDAGLGVRTAHTYVVQAVDAGGSTSSPTPSSAQVYTYALPTIQSFTASPTSSSSVNLSWSASDTNGPGLGGFTLTRQPSSGGAVTTFTPGVSATSYIDVGLTANTSYKYTLVANDGPASDTSAVATATASTYPVPAIASFSAQATSPTSVALNWSAGDAGGPNGGQLIYSVVNTTLGRAVSQCTSITQSACPSSDIVSAGSNYTYQLTAQDSTLDSVTATQSVWTPPSAPGTPSASAVTATTATISWSAAQGTVTNYAYTLNGGTTWTNVGTALSASLTGLSLLTSYTVQVRASNSGGNGPISSPGSFATPAYTDTASMTEGFKCSLPSVCWRGFSSGGFGSLIPTTLSGGLTVTGITDSQVTSIYKGGLSIAASSDPGSGWLLSITVGSVTLNGSAASYSYSSGTASWTWPARSYFGLMGTGTVSVSVTHK